MIKSNQIKMTELRITGIYGPKGGHFRLRIHSSDDAIRACVLLRHLGLGLIFQVGRTTIMQTDKYMQFDEIEKVLIKAGQARQKLFTVPAAPPLPLPPPLNKKRY